MVIGLEERLLLGIEDIDFDACYRLLIQDASMETEKLMFLSSMFQDIQKCQYLPSHSASHLPSIQTGQKRVNMLGYQNFRG